MKKLILAGLLLLGAAGAVAQTYFALGTSQVVTYGCVPSCSRQTSSQFGFQTRYVRVVVQAATAFIAFASSGVNPYASTTTGIYLPIGMPEIFRVPFGGKLSIIAHSATGSVTITELTQ